MLRRIVLVSTVAVFLLAACSRDTAPGTRGGTALPTGSAGSTSIVAEGGPAGLGSCAFAFGPETLAARQFGFDGTVTAIREPEAQDAPYEVDVAVTRWFVGGSGSSVTVRTYDVSGTSLAGELGVQVGDRILASGDDGFLWGCGFSMPYTEADAAVFEDVFGH